MTHTFFFLLVHFTDVCSLYLETNTKDCQNSLHLTAASLLCIYAEMKCKLPSWQVETVYVYHPSCLILISDISKARLVLWCPQIKQMFAEQNAPPDTEFVPGKH